ncbi:hypothetical protein DSO57_1005606 [Entomophthora muscae]|uniref:Uncharacterized protein n=2 Tax=Entomophthora muscae TaxID=34485 RepID=A0ACC2RMK1_9FUNG|nr:hypothetical protein DSO57_1005606 [Entomophthora muscae]
MSFREDAVKALRSPRFWGTVVLGQFMSLCITASSTTTRVMADNQLNIPTFQSTIVYLTLAVVFNSYAVWQYGLTGYASAIRSNGLYYFALAVFDVEANYFIVKGFATTSFLSALLINACSTPFVVLLTFMFLKTRYRWTHLLGISFTVLGLGLLVLSDYLATSEDTASHMTGNAFCFIAAFLYAVSNTLEEYCVRRQPKWEILAFLGLFGLIINVSQVLILERQELSAMTWSLKSGSAFIGFTVAMVLFYMLAPVLIGLTSATFFNISLLSSDFYGLIMGLAFFEARAHALYPIAFSCVIFGLLFYNFQPPPIPNAKVELPEDLEDGNNFSPPPTPRYNGST